MGRRQPLTRVFWDNRLVWLGKIAHVEEDGKKKSMLREGPTLFVPVHFAAENSCLCGRLFLLCEVAGRRRWVVIQ